MRKLGLAIAALGVWDVMGAKGIPGSEGQIIYTLTVNGKVQGTSVGTNPWGMGAPAGGIVTMGTTNTTKLDYAGALKNGSGVHDMFQFYPSDSLQSVYKTVPYFNLLLIGGGLLWAMKD